MVPLELIGGMCSPTVPPPPSRNGSNKNCAVIGGSTKNSTVIGQLIGEAILDELGKLAKPSAKASSRSSAATAINMTAQIDV